MESKDSDGPANSATTESLKHPERCRTCQKRKVKCGQEMPICFNCERLGLKCERKPKYTLKDVTQKTRRSIASTTSERGSIWDPNSVWTPRRHTPDENYTPLENEAASAKPGTYFVDANPYNFLDLYKDGEVSEVASSVGTVIGVPAPPGSVIMERFKDYGYRGSAATKSRGSQSLLKATLSRTLTGSEISGASVSTGANLANHFGSHSIQARTPSMPLSMFNKALVRSRDLQYYNHYRSVVVYNMQVITRFPTDVKPFCHLEGETEDPFETAASKFTPLYHAMMALSALSLAHRERLDRIDALEHYQQAVAGLRGYTSTESVNLIYTHYFLLLYEIAACEKGQTNLELNQMSQLVRLLGWFFTTIRTDPAHVFRDQACPECTQVSMTCIPSNMLYCDMYNLLLHRQLEVITPDIMVVGFFNAVDESETDPHVEAAFKKHLELARMMVKLNVLGGWAHRVLRNMVQDVNKLPEGQVPDLTEAHLELGRRIKDMNGWCAANSPPLPCNMYDDRYAQMPLQIQANFDSSQYTVRALLIYAHTSIYPTQRLSLPTSQEAYIQTLAREILTLTRPRWGTPNPIAASNLMAVFVCGAVVTTQEEKNEVLAVLKGMGGEASGRNFVCAIEALRDLYAEQERIKEHGGDERSLDWLVFLRGKGMLDFSLFGI